MIVDSARMVSITRFQRELTQSVRELVHSGEPLFILKNNELEAVMLSRENYQYLASLEEVFELFEVDDLIKQRLKTYNPKDNIPWSSLKEG